MIETSAASATRPRRRLQCRAVPASWLRLWSGRSHARHDQRVHRLRAADHPVRLTSLSWPAKCRSPHCRCGLIGANGRDAPPSGHRQQHEQSELSNDQSNQSNRRSRRRRRRFGLRGRRAGKRHHSGRSTGRSCGRNADRRGPLPPRLPWSPWFSWSRVPWPPVRTAWLPPRICSRFPFAWISRTARPPQPVRPLRNQGPGVRRR